MLLKPGVDIWRLERPIRRALSIIDSVYQDVGEELVITSTYEGGHSPGSLHYAGLAVDCRLPRTGAVKLCRDLQETLGKDFDVVLEKTHIHVEYDPKK